MITIKRVFKLTFSLEDISNILINKGITKYPFYFIFIKTIFVLGDVTSNVRKNLIKRHFKIKHLESFTTFPN
jgi:hypothetical protein